MADKIIHSKKSSTELHSKELQSDDMEKPKERYISPEIKTTNY